MTDLWIYGSGGFGRETAWAADAAGLVVAGFLDDGDDRSSVDGFPVRRPADVEIGSVVVAIADPAIRLRLTEPLHAAGWRFRSVVDPGAVFRGPSGLGEGSVVLGAAFVSTAVDLGAGAQVNYGATIGHDTTAGAALTVLPGANIAGSVTLGAGVTIGTGAAVLQGLAIGDGAVIGAGAVVTRDVEARTTVIGVPARPLG